MAHISIHRVKNSYHVSSLFKVVKSRLVTLRYNIASL